MNISKLGVFNQGDQCAWVGAGGKTSLIFALTKEISPDSCVISTTTKMALDEGKHVNHFIERNDLDSLEFYNIDGIFLIYKEKSITEPSKVKGFSENELLPFSQKLKAKNISFHIEADGSKRKPLKFPADHEPNIPSFVNKVCIVVGLSVLGKELNEENVHRSEIFAKLLGVPKGTIINLDHLFLLLSHPEGGLKNVPCSAEKLLFLNQADLIADKENLKQLVLRLKKFYDHIFLTCVSNHQLEIIAHWGKIGCAILAAGSSSRFGYPKQLARYKNKSFIENVIETTLSVNFDEYVVILGFRHEKILKVINKYNINTVINQEWERGQSTSVVQSINFLIRENVEAIIFLLVDQPQISVDQIHNVLNLYAYKKPSIIVHDYQGQNRHPILFSKTVFNDLKTLQGDQGGRQLFNKYPLEKIKITDQFFSIDVDTKSDLEKLGNN